MKLLTEQEAARLLGVTPDTMRQWRYLEKPPSYYKLGRLIRYADTDITKLLKRKPVKIERK